MLHKIVNATLLTATLGLSLLLGCDSHRMEKDFFALPPQSRLQKFGEYSLKDQFRIFRYGNDVVEPPELGLAKPIADRGERVVPFLLRQLSSDRSDANVRDILFVFSVMDASGSYDVKKDDATLITLASAVSGMQNKGWQTTCLAMLERIKQGTPKG